MNINYFCLVFFSSFAAKNSIVKISMKEMEKPCAIRPAILTRTFRGVAAATKLGSEDMNSIIQWIQSQESLAHDILFIEWRPAIQLKFENRDDLRMLTNVALGIAYMCETARNAHSGGIARDLQLVWSLLYEALIKLSPVFTVARSAQGFFAVPLCSLILDGNIDQLWRLHVWLADGQRGNHDTAIHSHQAYAQSWILASEGRDHSYDVIPTEDPSDATHALYQLVWNDGKTSNTAYKTHQVSSTIANTKDLVIATLNHSEVHSRDTTYHIPAMAFHETKVPPDACHATLFCFDSSRGFEKRAPVLGPISGDSFTQIRHPAGITPAELAEVVEALRSFDTLMETGKLQIQHAEIEKCLQSYHQALSLCENSNDFLGAQYYRSLVLGEIGCVERRFGRYKRAKSFLESSLSNMSDSLRRIQISGELGVVNRHLGQLGEAKIAIEDQLRTAQQLCSEREVCRAVGNLGMVNYQLFIQNQKNGDDSLLQLAIKQLEERIERAKSLKHPLWESIGQSRISLCYIALEKFDDAIRAASKSLETLLASKKTSKDSTAIAITRFFLGHAMLVTGRHKDALEQFNPRNTCTPVMAFCKEPSDEQCQYIREMIEAGADLDLVDEQGYTALDYAVFSGHQATEKVILEGLRRQFGKVADQQLPERQIQARVRKCYRQIIQESLRPEFLRNSHHLRNMRFIYHQALQSDQEKKKTFDSLKYIRYTDFAKFGRIPRSSDGLTQSLITKHETGADADTLDYMLFFSYRWINRNQRPQLTKPVQDEDHIGSQNAPSEVTSGKQPVEETQKRYLASPDDEANTQYRRMIRATEDFLNLHPSIDKERLGLWIVRAYLRGHFNLYYELMYHRISAALTKRTLCQVF
jgi:tetratricopeptide (TPR) repeat protein